MRGRTQQIGLAFAATLFLAAEPLTDADFEAMCTGLTEDRPDLMGECVSAEREAHGFVMSWFGYNGLLTPEGEVDSLQLLESQTDPMRGFYETPASTASLCIDATNEWVGLSECIITMDQNAQMMGMNPGMMGPDMGLGMGAGPGMDPGMWSEPGMN
ncbi:MAG: hypothetical protein RJB62_1978 [Pseudomonadota bacterium]|jgi:hypothetical protein